MGLSYGVYRRVRGDYYCVIALRLHWHEFWPLDPGTDLAGDFCASRIETEDRKKPRKMPTFKGDALMTTYSQINEKVRRSIRRSGIPPISRHFDWNPNRSAPNKNQAPWALRD
jgi:hypothetical protein